MKRKNSAGILMYRFVQKTVQFLLVHPGGPFWAKKDAGAWSIPKGELNEEEDQLDCAKREFEEETGLAPQGEFYSLKPSKQKSGKIIYCWAVEGDFDTTTLKSNFFEMEWPPRSGKTKEFPEVDKAEWFFLDEAIKKIIPGQSGFLLELYEIIEKSKH